MGLKLTDLPPHLQVIARKAAGIPEPRTRKPRFTGAKSARKRKAIRTMLIRPEAGPGRWAIVLPLRTLNRTNQREHWTGTHKRSSQERGIVWGMLAMNRGDLPRVPWLIRMTRTGPQILDDDNLRAALKSVRDGIADAAGLDDADPRLRFEYGPQERGDYAVRIQISNSRGTRPKPDATAVPAVSRSDATQSGSEGVIAGSGLIGRV